MASDGKYQGIAPECYMLCGKVLDHNGSGRLVHLLAGLQWVVEMLDQYPIKIVNLSIEIDEETNLDKDEITLLRKYLELLWKENIIVVVAAGNGGPKPMSISPIGEGAHCICVGCHDADYIGASGKTCSSYSGRGPGNPAEIAVSSNTNPIKKPDVVAPGTDIISCSHKAYFRRYAGRDTQNTSNREGVWYKAYVTKSGTSMATPMVSGACALCLQKYPHITNNDIRAVIMKSARDLGDSWDIQGSGMLQVRKMLESMII